MRSGGIHDGAEVDDDGGGAVGSCSWIVYLWTSTGTPLLHWETSSQHNTSTTKNAATMMKVVDTARLGELACLMLKLGEGSRQPTPDVSGFHSGGSSSSSSDSNRNGGGIYYQRTRMNLKSSSHHHSHFHDDAFGGNPATTVLTVVKRTIPFRFTVDSTEKCGENSSNHKEEDKLSIIVGVARINKQKRPRKQEETNNHCLLDESVGQQVEEEDDEEQTEEALRYMCARWIVDLCLPSSSSSLNSQLQPFASLLRAVEGTGEMIRDKMMISSTDLRDAVLFFSREDILAKDESRFNVRTILKNRSGEEGRQTEVCCEKSSFTKKADEQVDMEGLVGKTAAGGGGGVTSATARGAQFIAAQEFSLLVDDLPLLGGRLTGDQEEKGNIPQGSSAGLLSFLTSILDAAVCRCPWAPSVVHSAEEEAERGGAVVVDDGVKIMSFSFMVEASVGSVATVVDETEGIQATTTVTKRRMLIPLETHQCIPLRCLNSHDNGHLFHWEDREKFRAAAQLIVEWVIEKQQQKQQLCHHSNGMTFLPDDAAGCMSTSSSSSLPFLTCEKAVEFYHPFMPMGKETKSDGVVDMDDQTDAPPPPQPLFMLAIVDLASLITTHRSGDGGDRRDDVQKELRKLLQKCLLVDR